MKKYLIIVLCLCLCLCYSISSFAKTSKSNYIGVVKFVKGEVFISRPGVKKQIKVRKNKKIMRKDSIISRPYSIARVNMIDGSKLTFGPNTKFVFSKFKSRSKSKSKTIYSFVKGQMRGTFAKKAKSEEITIQTKTVAMGIRGTEILINGHLTKNKSEVAQMALLKGKVSLFDIIKQKKAILKPGHQCITIVNPGKTDYKIAVVKIDKTKYVKMMAHANINVNALKARYGQSKGNETAYASSATGNEQDSFFLDVYNKDDI